MFKHTISELQEALICLQAGQVTLPYPLLPHPVEGTFRGLPVLHIEQCIGCGACVNACPARLITITDRDSIRTLRFDLGRCTFCANCRDACPQEALEMSTQFEISTADPEDLVTQAAFSLLLCEECGAVVGTQRAVELVREKLSERAFQSKYDSYSNLCLSCRRRLALFIPSLNLEVLV